MTEEARLPLFEAIESGFLIVNDLIGIVNALVENIAKVFAVGFETCVHNMLVQFRQFQPLLVLAQNDVPDTSLGRLVPAAFHRFIRFRGRNSLRFCPLQTGNQLIDAGQFLLQSFPLLRHSIELRPSVIQHPFQISD